MSGGRAIFSVETACYNLHLLNSIRRKVKVTSTCEVVVDSYTIDDISDFIRPAASYMKISPCTFDNAGLLAQNTIQSRICKSFDL